MSTDQLTESYRQHLPATRALIADKARWTTGALALAADGTPCDPNDPDTVALCLVGAFTRVTDLPAGDAENVLTMLLDAFPARVNDRAGHAAVLALLDRAIRAGSSVQSR
jgi:hypothetical protein